MAPARPRQAPEMPPAGGGTQGMEQVNIEG